MALAHATAAVQASASNGAGSTTTGSWIDIRSYKPSILAKVTNGGTGPTVPCTCTVDLSPDNGSTVYAGAGGSFTAGIASSTPYAFGFDLPPDTMYARTVFSGNIGQAVTIQADVTKQTGL
jgi:hypothetical protein